MGHKIRVLHITLFMDIGGMEKIIIELCRRANPELLEVEVLCLHGYDPKYVNVLIESGVPVHLKLKKHRYDFRYFKKTADFIKSRRIDIIHVHSGCYFYAAVFAYLAQVSGLVYTAHGLPVLNRVKDYIEDSLAGFLTDTIVAVSDEVRSVLDRRMPFARHKLVSIINGIDTEQFRPVDDELKKTEIALKYDLPQNIFWIGSVGRLEPVKNYSMLLRTFSSLKKVTDKPVGLVLVGDGAEDAKLKELAEELQIGNDVHFLGMQYAVHEILPLLSVFVLSSLTEGTSVSLLEAQACGIPAVATAVGGNSDIIEPERNGYLCEVNDDDSMCHALNRLLSNPIQAEKLGRRGRLIVEGSYSQDTMVKKYEEIYTKIYSRV